MHDFSGNVDPAAKFRVYPAILGVDEKSDTFQLDLTHHYKKINYGAGVSYDRYQSGIGVGNGSTNSGTLVSFALALPSMK